LFGHGRENVVDIWLVVLLAVVAVLVIAMLAIATVLLVKLVKSYRLLRHSAEIPRANKVAFWGALVYAVCPVDLLPDPVYLDDIVILITALRSLRKAAEKLKASENGQDSHAIPSLHKAEGKREHHVPAAPSRPAE
jgi:uncharacterized membrane protein YkvA (DUF1232 family)